MNLNTFIDMGIELEETISACYEGLSKLSHDETLSWRLNKMAQEEKNHANLLRSGKNYIQMIPEAFGQECMTAAEIRAGLKLTKSLLQKIHQKPDLRSGLKNLLELEKRFEKAHLDTSIEIKEAFLKKLFQDLSQEDKTHTQSLEEMISSLP